MIENLPRLEWDDLAREETELCRLLSRFIRFDDHSLYFARSELVEPELIEEENRLLLPLMAKDGVTAILRLDNVASADLQPAMPHLSGIIRLCLENIGLAVSRVRDSGTGLYSEEAFLDLLCQRIESMHSADQSGESCLAMLVLNWPGAGSDSMPVDNASFNVCWKQIATIFRAALPTGAIAARLGRLEGRSGLAAFLPATGRGICQKLAETILDELSAVRYYNPVSQSCLEPRFAAGHALYPQDMHGRDILASPARQALQLRNHARLAAEMAWQTERLAKPVTSYAWIHALCGRVDELLSYRYVRVNLGQNANIQENQRFHVIGSGDEWNQASSKGQIIIRKVGESDSLAEIFHIRYAGVKLARGDGLMPVLFADENALHLPGGFLQQGEFINEFEKICRGCSRFALSVTRFWFKQRDESESGSALQSRISQLISLCGTEILSTGICGWYGSDGVILFMQETDAIRPLLERLHEKAGDCGMGAASGIFLYPLLNFAKEESEANALKALAYAELLPSPHIGVLDDQALAIDADRRFSDGDEPGAIDEYQLALLLKPGDRMILNSLGVCLASINRRDEAKQKFAAALSGCEDNEMRARISYNLGNLFQKENDLHEARNCYRDCVRAKPEHIYAWARLGQIYRKAGRPKGSHAFYRHASRLAQNEPAALNMIQRQLARLETEGNKVEKAREILHDSLLRNPADHASLLLLAETYVNDDPAMAETLARKCLRLGGDASGILKEALAALGQSDTASKKASKGRRE